MLRNHLPAINTTVSAKSIFINNFLHTTRRKSSNIKSSSYLRFFKILFIYFTDCFVSCFDIVWVQASSNSDNLVNFTFIVLIIKALRTTRNIKHAGLRAVIKYLFSYQHCSGLTVSCFVIQHDFILPTVSVQLLPITHLLCKICFYPFLHNECRLYNGHLC